MVQDLYLGEVQGWRNGFCYCRYLTISWLEHFPKFNKRGSVISVIRMSWGGSFLKINKGGGWTSIRDLSVHGLPLNQ